MIDTGLLRQQSRFILARTLARFLPCLPTTRQNFPSRVELTLIDQRLRLRRYCDDLRRAFLQQIVFGAQLDELVRRLNELFRNVFVGNALFAELGENGPQRGNLYAFFTRDPFHFR